MILTTKIYPVGDTLTVFLADDKDSITFTGNGQVARHADGFKQSDLVFGYVVLAGGFYLT